MDSFNTIAPRCHEKVRGAGGCRLPGLVRLSGSDGGLRRSVGTRSGEFVLHVVIIVPEVLGLDAFEDELGLAALALDVDLDGLTPSDLLELDLPRQSVLDLELAGPAQRSGTQHSIVAALGEQVLRRIRDLDLHALVGKTAIEALEEEVDDLDDLFHAQLREHDRVIDAVEELGAEVLLELLVDLLLHPVVVGLRVPLDLESELESAG